MASGDFSTQRGDPLVTSLNPAQAQAVTHVHGPLLVFAGAGSGKTRVITHRIAYLIERQRVPAYRILAVTFTNKAAGEMKHRLARLLGEREAADCWVGTFHAVCARLLRRYYEPVGLRQNFLIYDDSDQRSVVARVLKELGFDDRRYPPRLLLSRIMKQKQEGKRLEDFESESYTDDVVRQVYEGYQAYLTAANAVDFEDLIGHVMRLAETKPSLVADELRARFQHVLVDEFQDTNHCQYRLVRALATEHRNLCVVGDDDQSIYRWRGGDVKLIRGFHRDFPDAVVVKLEQNYRSSGHIVRAALGVIRPSQEREPKELFTENSDGAPVRIVSVRTEREEASYVGKSIREALANGTDAADVAVFYRIHAMSRVLEEVLRIENIPYRVVGGTRFFDRAEVKDILSYLRVVLNPRSDVDLLRIINVPARAIGQTTVERLAQHAASRSTSLFDALDSVETATSLAAAARKKLAAFQVLLHEFRAYAAEHTPTELARLVLDKTGYLAMLEAENSAEADARKENLQELLASLQEYEDAAKAEGEAPSLEGYLERVTLASSPDEQGAAPRVSLMTVHSAKGLEFDHVFLVGVEEQIFPYERNGDPDSVDEEEERRLAYVAITRARKQLVLLHTSMRMLFGNTRCAGPSRFLDDLPREGVEHIVLQPATSLAFGPSQPTAAKHVPPRSSPKRSPGERYVERDDSALAGIDGWSRGLRVRHQRFGEGMVEDIQEGADPSAMVRFPGWGARKVLLRFLTPT